MKTCKQCNAEKSLHDFPKDPRNPDGRTGQCKECRNVYIKAWRVAHAPPKMVRVFSENKLCTGCRIDKPRSQFHKGNSKCKPCQSEYEKAWRKENPEKVKANNELSKNRVVIPTEGATQVCTKCDIEKPISAFRRAPGMAIGVRKECMECAQIAATKRYRDNPESARQKASEWVKNNPQKATEVRRASYVKHRATRLKARKEWRAKNLEKDRAREKRYLKDNRPIVYAKNARRRAAETQAVPHWLTAIHKAQIQEFYEIASARTMQTGIKNHVDHKIPLRGDSVCGLHVPWNLQALTEFENCSKHNKILEGVA